MHTFCAHNRLEALLADERSLDVRVITFSAHALLAAGAVAAPTDAPRAAGARSWRPRRVAAAQPQLQLLHSAAALGLTARARDAPQQVLNDQLHGNPELVTAVVTAATAAAAAAAAAETSTTGGSSSSKASARKAGAARTASALSHNYFYDCLDDDDSDCFDGLPTPRSRRPAAKLPASPLYTALPWPANVRALLALGFSADADVENRCGETPLHWAAAGGQVLSAQCLLEADATVDAEDCCDEDCSGRTPLMHAAAGGHAVVCTVLLQAGAVCGVDSFAVHGELSPLWCAAARKLSCEDDNEQTVYTTSGTTAAVVAAAARAAACNTSAECLGVLAQGSTAALCSVHKKRGSLLHAAATSNNVPAIAYLLQQGAAATDCMQAANSRGYTALEVAAHAGSVGSVKLLLEAGASLIVSSDSTTNSSSSSSTNSGSSGVESSVLGRCLLKGSCAVCFELLLDASARAAADDDTTTTSATFASSGVSQSTLW
jgi:ankyrin repeat protein